MKTLQEIANEIGVCKECKKGKSGLPVPGEGNPNAKLFFVGEAPGAQESETGRPFVGRAGKYLTKLIESTGLKREDVYITSPVKYFPGKRAPNDEEIEHGKIHLIEQIEAVKPKIVVLLGSVAHKSLVGEVKISKVHGQIVRRNNEIYFSTFHPAAAVRGYFIKETESDFKKLKTLLKKNKII